MAKLFASWVPGHAVSIERPPNSFIRQGFGVTTSVEGPQHTGGAIAVNYFHIAIPTPVIVEGKRATLHNVHYLFDARRGAKLAEVIVYDGQHVIGHSPPGFVPPTGDHTGGLDAANGWRSCWRRSSTSAGPPVGSTSPSPHSASRSGHSSSASASSCSPAPADGWS